MKKVGLQDIKKQNRQVIMRSILEHGSLSRIEIAQYTQLSPSTVTVLVNEIIEDGLLIESGTSASTGGRKRVELSVNGDFGDICVVDISRKRSTLHIYDMNLHEQSTIALSNRYISGNDLFIAITSAVLTHYGVEECRKKKLQGFGLLFQEDIQASECNVMYSTSLSSASISLKEALVTQFRTTVVEDHTSSYSLFAALDTSDKTKHNSAHITIGNSILASITIQGKPVPLKSGRFSDITPLLHNIGNDIPQLPLLEALCKKEPCPSEKALTPPQSRLLSAFSKQISSIITLLCTLFPLDIIFLSGNITKVGGFMGTVREMTSENMAPAPSPDIQVLDAFQQPISNLLAEKIRKSVLCTH